MTNQEVHSLQALPVHTCAYWLDRAPPDALQTAEGRQLAKKFVSFASEASNSVLEAMADRVDVLARTGLLPAAFSSGPDGKEFDGTLEQLQVHLMQVLAFL